jgi:hypothetical protein
MMDSPARPEVVVYNYREPGRARLKWAVALDGRLDSMISRGHGSRAEAEESAERAATELGGLAVRVLRC